MVVKRGQWKHGLWGCCDDRHVYLLSYFCPCYLYGKNAQALGESFLFACFISIVPVANIVLGTLTRGKIRERQEIPGSAFNDCLMTSCCPPCSLAQQAQEVTYFVPQAIEIDRA